MICTNSPTLRLAQRAGLHDTYGIAFLAGFVQALGNELRRLVHELAVDRMLYLTGHCNHDGFLHLLLTTTPIRSFLRFLSITVINI